jgi:murein DD-endopeptidase MepM/ murein hydrolase activator NlpD
MKLYYPLEGIGTKPGVYITQRFGQNLNDYSQFGMKGHNGIDIAAPLGTPIKAIHDGDIEFYTEAQNYGTGYGKNVRLYFKESGFTYEFVFGHLNAYEGVNRFVKRGDVIGYVGTTGFSTGPHLHLGGRKLLNGLVVEYNNGYFGYFDIEPLFKESMSNSLLVKKGMEYGFYDPATSADGLITMMLHRGIAPPLKADKTLDWDEVDKLVKGQVV